LAEDMRDLGLEDEIAGAPTEGEVEPDLCEIWRDNLPTWDVFLSLETQWDIVAAADGELVMTGIRYESIEVVLRNTNGVPRRQWAEIFANLRAMEKAALRVINKAREERRELRHDEWEASRTKQ
jgi:hypothetical protein